MLALNIFELNSSDNGNIPKLETRITLGDPIAAVES